MSDEQIAVLEVEATVSPERATRIHDAASMCGVIETWEYAESNGQATIKLKISGMKTFLEALEAKLKAAAIPDAKISLSIAS